MQKFSKCEKWDDSHVIIFYAPGEVKHGEETVEEYTKHVVVTEASKPAIVEALVRTGFSFEKDGNVVDHPGLSIGEELALNRQRNSKKAEFNDYNDFAEAAKATADAILEGLKEE